MRRRLSKSPLDQVGLTFIPVSVGELADKMTILEIKSEQMADPAKLNNVRAELDLLRAAWNQVAGNLDVGLSELIRELKKTNQSLWTIEDDIRACELNSDFGNRFVELARSVYKTNDRRSEIKREINVLVGSTIIEEKSYQKY